MHEDQQLHINLPSTQLTLLPRYGTYVMTVHRNQDPSQYKEQYAEQPHIPWDTLRVLKDSAAPLS